MTVAPAVRSDEAPVAEEESSMADKAAKAEGPGDEADSGEEQATADGPAKSRNSSGQEDTTSAGDDLQPKFREALERKRAREAGTIGAPGGKSTGKVHDAHGPAMARRSFRRKSG
jgi:Family of unknown function (DUF5302)